MPKDRKLVVLLPGSRAGEARRHLPTLIETIKELRRRFDVTAIVAIPQGFRTRAGLAIYREPLEALSIKVIENETWDCIGHADVALAASGTVTVEAAVLGTPMVTFYKVTRLSWWAGRHLVKVPFLSMVNLIAERKIVPELIQDDMTPSKIAQSAYQLLSDDSLANAMRMELAAVKMSLTGKGDPFRTVANLILEAVGHKLTTAVKA